MYPTDEVQKHLSQAMAIHIAVDSFATINKPEDIYLGIYATSLVDPSKFILLDTPETITKYIRDYIEAEGGSIDREQAIDTVLEAMQNLYHKKVTVIE